MKLSITFLLVFHALVIHAQNDIVFKHLNVEDGLSQSSVLSIAQDAKGFMWFGTRFGLNKYDSRNFRTYTYSKKQPHSLSGSEYIHTILSTKDGSLWIGTPAGLNKYNEAKDNFDRILPNAKIKDGINSSIINCIYQDRQDRIWVGTDNGLNLLTSKKGYHFKHFLFDQKKPNQIYALFQDHKGLYWLSTSAGLASMQIEKGKAKLHYFSAFNDKLNKAIDNHITCFLEDENNMLWIGTKQTGLSRLNLQTQEIVPYTYSSLNPNGISSNNIRKMIKDARGRIWIGTLHGINIYDPATQKFSALQNEAENNNSLSQNSVYALFLDKQDIMWVGTYFGGINMTYPNYTPFKILQSAKTGKGLSSNVVSAITEDKNHNLWIGSEGEGLNYFDRSKNSYTHYRYNPNNPNTLSSNLVKSIFRDKKNRIWIGTHLGGLNLYLPESNSFIRYTSKQNDNSTISSDEITNVFEDSHGRFWVGTTNGLNSFDPETGKFIRKRINGLSDAVFYIFEDSRRRLFVATNSGFYFLDKNSQKFKGLKYGDVSCVTEAKNGILWVGTLRNGIFKLNPSNKIIARIQQRDGLPSNNIVGILEDDQENIWISTDNGLSRYSPGKKVFKNYNIKDGLPGNEFNYKSLLKDARGEFFFGGLNGLVSFFPSQIKENKTVPSAVFTSLKLFNKPVEPSENGLLQTNISNAKEIVFKSSQNVFTIDFTVLNFIKPDKNRYAYKLLGFEKNWNYVDVPSANYTNLSPGTYQLLVKGCNNDGVWTEKPAAITIKILPPFYKTWWAYLLYAIFAAAVLFVLIRYLLIKAILIKEKETNEHKLEFFTNISHEIRTPLTLIVGPLEKLIGDSIDNPELTRNLQPIKSQSDRLMNLVTELLDFRKAESGKMNLEIGPVNFVKFCKEIFLAFQNLAISKEIEYIFESESDDIELYLDKVQMEKVFFNLLSNAFKFTDTKGSIFLKIIQSEAYIMVKVGDNGKGIPFEYQANLFNSFYQANPSTNIGTGLGLSLSKSIVELHHGRIDLKSEPQQATAKGSTCFTVNLKRGKAHFSNINLISDYIYDDDASNHINQKVNQPKIQIASTASDNTVTTDKKYTILLVEDNLEVRNFIVEALAKTYNIYQAEDGEQGWETSITLIPDLILSDVMMPKMDGLALCRKLKTDERTSHIPVILLTARSAYVHQLNGFENGADAYIMKPFDLNILKLNILNLLNARETIRQKFGKVVTLEPKNIVINKTEENFLNKVMQIIEDNLTDPDFDVNRLAQEIGMSLPVMYKKIKALTDLKVNEFIKSIRLKKAAQLLKANNGNITEIAYSVGFNDRKYFSIEFKKYYGKTPSTYIADEGRSV
jgi:ligand-binding sensor domain-containing protein/signal transduction histidine kinase/DNA-binding response OmpR family regulator